MYQEVHSPRLPGTRVEQGRVRLLGSVRGEVFRCYDEGQREDAGRSAGGGDGYGRDVTCERIWHGDSMHGEVLHSIVRGRRTSADTEFDSRGSEVRKATATRFDMAHIIRMYTLHKITEKTRRAYICLLSCVEGSGYRKNQRLPFHLHQQRQR